MHEDLVDVKAALLVRGWNLAKLANYLLSLVSIEVAFGNGNCVDAFCCEPFLVLHVRVTVTWLHHGVEDPNRPFDVERGT